jgi:hypothetical protein
VRAASFEALQKHFVWQYKSHCGAASAVVVVNALLGETRHTQDSIFCDDTFHIISRDVVWDAGFTLKQLADTIRAITPFRVEEVQCSAANARATTDVLRTQLRRFRTDPLFHVIVNFSFESLKGLGMGRGHFTPVWEFNEEQDRVLLLEVFAERKHCWVATEDLLLAMQATDPENGEARGWLTVEAQAPPHAEASSPTR